MHDRVRTWLVKTLRRSPWLLLLVPYELLKDWGAEWGRSHLSRGLLLTVIEALPPLWVIVPIAVVVLLVHAYFDTRPKQPQTTRERGLFDTDSRPGRTDSSRTVETGGRITEQRTVKRPPPTPRVVPVTFTSAPSSTTGAPIMEMGNPVVPGHFVLGESVRLTLRTGMNQGIPALEALSRTLSPRFPLGCTVVTPDQGRYVNEGIPEGTDGGSTLFPDNFAGAPPGLPPGAYLAVWTRGAIADPIAQHPFTVEGQ